MEFKLMFVLFILFEICQAKVSYLNYKLINLAPSEEIHLKMIKNWIHNSDFDVWKREAKSLDICLSPGAFDKYKREFLRTNMSFLIINENVESLISPPNNGPHGRIYTGIYSTVGRFATYEEIVDYMLEVERLNPSFVSTYSIGKSFEGKDLVILVFKRPSATRSLWIDCGIHAREWLFSPIEHFYETKSAIIAKLLNEINNLEPITSRLLDKYEIFILPIMNPDGYVYTHQHDRMWRKNRAPDMFRNTGCFGVDLNRNFDHEWLKVGSSSDPCSEIYAGVHAASENEVNFVQNAIKSKQGKWDAYISLHSYGQYWFTPWSYTNGVTLDHSDMFEKALIGVSAIEKVAGSHFKIGTAGSLLYPSSGCSDDWAKAVANIKYTYCIELRPEQHSHSYGFLLNEAEIPVAGEETFQGLKALFNAIYERF